MDEIKTPALEWLLADEKFSRDYDGTPLECCDCPFGRAAATRLDELEVWSRWSAPNPSDPGEGHYWCDLLDLSEPVWGENPRCEVKDWRRRARAELRIVLGLDPGRTGAGEAGEQ